MMTEYSSLNNKMRPADFHHATVLYGNCMKVDQTLLGSYNYSDNNMSTNESYTINGQYGTSSYSDLITSSQPNNLMQSSQCSTSNTELFSNFYNNIVQQHNTSEYAQHSYSNTTNTSSSNLMPIAANQTANNYSLIETPMEDNQSFGCNAQPNWMLNNDKKIISSNRYFSNETQKDAAFSLSLMNNSTTAVINADQLSTATTINDNKLNDSSAKSFSQIKQLKQKQLNTFNNASKIKDPRQEKLDSKKANLKTMQSNKEAKKKDGIKVLSPLLQDRKSVV